MSVGLLLDSAAQQWSAVLGQLAAAFPDSGYSMLSSLDESALEWREVMHDVPDYGVTLLYRRLMRGWKKTSAPGIGDFTVAWDAWESFYLDTNAEAHLREEDGAALSIPAIASAVAVVLPALTDGLPPEEARRTATRIERAAQAARMQIERMNAKRAPVTCECLDLHGHPVAAGLSADGEHWVCVSQHMVKDYPLHLNPAQCAFRWPVVDTDLAPIRLTERQVRPFTPGASDEAHHAGPLLFTDIEIVQRLRDCGMAIEQGRPPLLKASGVDFEKARGFGRRLEQLVPPALWSEELCCSMWRAWNVK